MKIIRPASKFLNKSLLHFCLLLQTPKTLFPKANKIKVKNTIYKWEGIKISKNIYEIKKEISRKNKFVDSSLLNPDMIEKVIIRIIVINIPESILPWEKTEFNTTIKLKTSSNKVPSKSLTMSFSFKLVALL